MRIKLHHKISFTFAEPARSLTQILRLTPRSHDGQRIKNWRIDVEPDCRLKAGEDHFGNLTHTLTVPGVVSELGITVHGEIANFDAAGVVRGSAERLPPELYLRDTPATAADGEIRAFADRVAARAEDRIGKLHCLMDALHETIETDASGASSTAIEAFRAGRGGFQDQAHVFIACARHLGWPARCATGYFAPEDDENRRHAWAEVQVEGLGWVGFDPMNDICPQDSHIRMAIGLDALDSAAIRGTRLDGLTESLKVKWLLKRDDGAMSSQSQAHIGRR